jgi:DNA mismatch repair protein MutL
MTESTSATLPPRIRILSPELVAMIAAGEVIERPASVVKELVENSIDAGARKISIAIRQSPDRFLRVLDDGCGMSEEEAHLALRRHATSKLTSAEDLARVRTLGFRGEALPTIAQVSRLTLATRGSGSLGGIQIEVAGGAILSSGPVGRPPGTAITVADLFFNTPARRKFLRSERGEMRAVSRTVTSYALVLPGVHFLLSQDEVELLNLPPVADLATRVGLVYGAETAAEIVPVQFVNDLVEIRGVVGTPDLHRGNRDHQTFFVNGRWIQNPLLGHAVRTAYRNRIPADRHPFAVLDLEVDPRQVDVNVHPTKREVKFSRESEVYSAIVRAVDAAIREVSVRFGDSAFVVPEMGSDSTAIQYALTRDLASATRDDRGWLGLGPPDAGAPPHDPAGERAALGPALGGAPLFAGTPLESEPGPAPGGATIGAADWAPGFGELAPLWQLHHTYILSPVKGGVLIVDQHVAHERILYERILAALRSRPAPSQRIMFNDVLDFAPADLDQLVEALPSLEQIGFELRVIGQRSVSVLGVPAALDRWDGGRFLRDFVTTLGRERRAGGGLEESIAASFACHAAVRKGDSLSLVQMNRLIEDLFHCEVPTACPHGRPIVLKLTLDELDRRFGRT